MPRADGGPYIAKYSYDDLGRETLIDRSNGTTTTSTYSGTSLSWTLAQDAAGTAQDVTFGLSFTPTPQLYERTISNSSYAYGTTASTTNYSPNGLNQYAAVGGTAFSYDGRGNLTSDGSRTMAYDLENHLTSVSSSASMTLAYDPKGRLHQTDASSSTVFLYDGDSLVEELDTSATPNILRRYIPGNSVDDTLVWYEGGGLSTPNWLHADEQGTVIATTNGLGAATQYVYSATGQPTSWSGTRFRYTGQAALPEVQLYYYKARMYDPHLGRFLQTDPIGYGDDYNLYAYVGNDPVNRVDPSGQFQVCIPGWDITVAEEGHEATVHMPTVCQDYPDSILAPLPHPSIPPSKDRPPGNGTNPIKISSAAKDFVCRALKANDFNANRAEWSAYNFRNDPNHPEQRYNPTARVGENWLTAASRANYYWTFSLQNYAPAIYAWQYAKLIPGFSDTNDSFSQEALDAGLNGLEHLNDTPTQLRALCGD